VALELAEAVARDPAQSADVGEALLILGLAQRAAGEGAKSDALLARAAVPLAGGLGERHALTREALASAR
jgi:hypothetical protein